MGGVEEVSRGEGGMGEGLKGMTELEYQKFLAPIKALVKCPLISDIQRVHLFSYKQRVHLFSYIHHVH